MVFVYGAWESSPGLQYWLIVGLLHKKTCTFCGRTYLRLCCLIGAHCVTTSPLLVFYWLAHPAPPSYIVSVSEVRCTLLTGFECLLSLEYLMGEPPCLLVSRCKVLPPGQLPAMFSRCVDSFFFGFCVPSSDSTLVNCHLRHRSVTVFLLWHAEAKNALFQGNSS